MSTKSMLGQLVTASEHAAGYDRAKFTLWTDADHDGCDTRDEVLIQEATTRPHVGAGCALTGGTWRSRYDGVITADPSTFDIDHLVPLNEAWQSGAWNWSSATRRAYANDLSYRADLIAVTAHENRSKGDREPQDWMPDRTAYACTYLKHWVAVKWRWHLTVNATERSFLTSRLTTCGWPRDPTPTRPTIVSGGTGTPSPTPTPGPSTGSGTVSYAVHPGAFCSEHWRVRLHGGRHTDALHDDSDGLELPVALGLLTAVRGSGVLEAEADLHADLDVLGCAVDDLATHLGDLEPVEVPQGLRGPREAVADGVVDPFARRTDDLGDAVGAVGHRGLLGGSTGDLL